TGAQMLADLGVGSLRLLTNNPAKVRGLAGFGIEVAGRVPLPASATPDNVRYLMAKRDRLGHQIDGLPESPLAEAGHPGLAAEHPVPAAGPAPAADLPPDRDSPAAARPAAA